MGNDTSRTVALASPSGIALDGSAQPRQKAITWRAALLGLLAAIGIAVLSPYNDLVLGNGGLAGGSLPASVLALLFLLVVAINAPLRRYAPGKALSTGELVVITCMALASCTIPHHGLFRFMIPNIVMPLYHGGSVAEFRELFLKMNLPTWLFPDFGDTPRDRWFGHPLVQGFHERWSDPTHSPYGAWLVPLFTWGIFAFAMYGVLMGIVSIVHRQWIENERLAFPLAQVQLSLLEAPPRGSAFNALLSNRWFWIALAMIFGLQIWNGMASYYPRYFPKFPLSFDFTKVYSEPPLSFMQDRAKMGAFSIGLIALCFFIPTTTSFSIWFFFLALQAFRMIKGTTTGDGEVYGIEDQHFGSAIALVGTILWVGRHQWKLVLAQAFRGPKGDEPRGRYLSYRFAFWMMLVSLAVMVGWLVMAGMTLLGAIVSVTMLIVLMVVVSRVVAETGMSDAALDILNYRPMIYASAAGWTKLFPVKDLLFSAYVGADHYQVRETLNVFGTHATKIADQTIYQGRPTIEDGPRQRRAGAMFVGLMMLAVLASYVSGSYAHLWIQYHHSVTLRQPSTNLDPWGAGDNSRWFIVQPTVDYSHGLPPATHSRAGNFTFGLGFTAFLAFMRLHYTWWPFHPLGYMLVSTGPVQWGWTSFLIGWLLKTMTIKYGGAKLYTSMRPFLIGIIVGEALAVIFWLSAGFVLASMGIAIRG